MDSNEVFRLLSQFQWPDQTETSQPQNPQPGIHNNHQSIYQSIEHNATFHESIMNHNIGDPGSLVDNNAWIQEASFSPPAPVSFLTPSNNPGPPLSEQISQRNKYGQLDWDSQRDALKELYLTENKTLSETMRIMKERHGFEGSMKLYKDRFRQWNWSKNLPTEVAEFMATKLKRRRESGLDTIFTYGGRDWDRERVESTLRRSKKRRENENAFDRSTPEGVTYRTPPPPPLSASVGSSSRSVHVGESLPRKGNVAIPGINQPPSLIWKGHTRSDILTLWETSRKCSAAGQTEAAREKLIAALEGMRHLCGVIQDDSNKIAYELTALYFQRNLHREGDAVLDQVTQMHFQKLGPQHKRTRQHILQSVELLNSWGRHDDALGLIAHLDEILEYHHKDQPHIHEAAEANSEGRFPDSPKALETSSLHRLPRSRDPSPEDETSSSPGTIEDFGTNLSLADIVGVPSEDIAVEKLLLTTIKYCESHPLQYCRQNLEAYRDILNLYNKPGLLHRYHHALLQALETVSTVLSGYPWRQQKHRAIAIMEACLQVIAIIVKCGWIPASHQLLEEISKKAELLFGSADERSIWIDISIGLLYQTYRGWGVAEEWFQRALDRVADREREDDDDMLKLLERAYDKKHFSFLDDDEGSSLRTVFCPSGVTIRPRKLYEEPGSTADLD